MKTFKLIGMALVAVMMCVNFAACSSDDEPGDVPSKDENGVVTNMKKIKEIELKNDKGNREIWVGFTYDSNGHLTSIAYKEGNSEDASYTYFAWDENSVTSTNRYGTITYNIKNGLVNNSQDVGQWGDIDNDTYTYNSSKQLTAFGDIEECYFTFVWNNDRITQSTDCSEVSYTYSYSKNTCKGWCPLYADWGGSYAFWDAFGHTGNELFFAHPELAGVKNTHLPDKMQSTDGSLTVSYAYTFYDDGYVKTCTAIEMEDNDTDAYVYSFIWE